MANHKTAIIIAYLNEPDLNNTIADIEKQGKYFIYAEEDTTNEGPGRTRHKAICRAREDGCDGFIIVDAHMRFQPRTFQRIMQRARRIKKGIVCAKCHHNETLSFDDKPYEGAKFTLKANNGLEKVACGAQWNETSPKERTIGAIMGACYAMTMKWYETIGEPLRLLNSWGSDEEYLSACTYFAGGVCEIHPAEVAHLCRAKGVATPTTNLTSRIWANRLQLLDILPFSEEVRDDLRNWMCQSATVTVNWSKIVKIMDKNRSEISKLREHLSKFGQKEAGFLRMARDYAECDKKLSLVKKAKNEAKEKEKPVIINYTPPQSTCPECGYANPWSKRQGFRQQGSQWHCPTWCKRCGRKGQMILVE